MQNAQNTILDQLRAIPKGTKVRFLLRDPDGDVFPHVSAIDHYRDSDYPDGFDLCCEEVALATVINPHDAEVNPWWVSYASTPVRRSRVCSIVGIEPLPTLETLQKWVEDGTTVRIEYAPDRATAERVGPSPITCKLLQARGGDFGLAVRVASGWNMFLDAEKGAIGYCRPLVTSIAPVTEAVQTPEEIDAIMQRAAHEGTWVSAVTASGETHVGDVLDSGGGDFMRYRVPAQGESIHEYWWLDADSDSVEERRIVSVSELPAEKQSEAEMLVLLQAAERDGSHVEATMADGSKRAGAVSGIVMGRILFPVNQMVRCFVDGQGVSFGAFSDHERIAAVKALPREEKRPDVQTYDPSKVTITIGSPSPLASLLGFDGPFTISGGDTLTLTGERATGNPIVTPTCCADVAPYIGRRVRVDDGNEGILTGCGIDDDGDCWFGLDYENPDNADERCYYSTWTFELLPDEPAPSGNLMIAPTCPADLEPYLGRRVRVLAGEEREVVREGILLAASDCGFASLTVGGRPSAGWAYGPGSCRSTLVEVLPALQDAQPHASGSLQWNAGQLTMQVDEESHASDGEEPAPFAPTVESKLTLADMLKLAPSPADVRAFESFQLTVREAMTTGVIRG